MAHGALAPEMMSSTKLSTVSAQMKRDGESIKNRDVPAVREPVETSEILSGQRRPWFGVFFVVVCFVFFFWPFHC